jgi:hypothetical protein|tara:strand:- start:302 stop:511 length:210 start_codon:yes stop_codon:yes gene_type:complete
MKTLMQTRHFEYLADEVAPLMGWPSQIHIMADKLAKTNPRFDKEKFLERAIQAWEDKHPPMEFDDEIPY